MTQSPFSAFLNVALALKPALAFLFSAPPRRPLRLCVKLFASPHLNEPVSYANRLPFSRRLVNRLQNNHVEMSLPSIGRDRLLRLSRLRKRIQFRRKLIHHPEFLLEPLSANLPRQPPLFIKRKRRRQASPPFRPLHKHKR